MCSFAHFLETFLSDRVSKNIFGKRFIFQIPPPVSVFVAEMLAARLGPVPVHGAFVSGFPPVPCMGMAFHPHQFSLFFCSFLPAVIGL